LGYVSNFSYEEGDYVLLNSHLWRARFETNSIQPGSNDDLQYLAWQDYGNCSQSDEDLQLFPIIAAIQGDGCSFDSSNATVTIAASGADFVYVINVADNGILDALIINSFERVPVSTVDGNTFSYTFTNVQENSRIEAFCRTTQEKPYE